MERLKIVLPWPPSVNHYYERNRACIKKNGQRGKAFRIGKKGELFRQEAVIRVAQYGARKRLSGRLDVVIKVYPPNARDYDMDNLLKAVQDSLTFGGVWVDDKQIKLLRLQEVAILRPAGQLEVLVREMEG